MRNGQHSSVRVALYSMTRVGQVGHGGAFWRVVALGGVCMWLYGLASDIVIRLEWIVVGLAIGKCGT